MQSIHFLGRWKSERAEHSFSPKPLEPRPAPRRWVPPGRNVNKEVIEVVGVNGERLSVILRETVVVSGRRQALVSADLLHLGAIAAPIIGAGVVAKRRL